MRTRPYRLAVVAFAEMDLLDVAGPLEVFSTAGRKWNFRAVKAELVCREPGLVATRAQLGVGAARSFAEASPPELVLIPGGYGARRAAESPELLAFLRASAPELVLTVGLGALVAAAAGLLRDAEVATTASLAPELTALEPSLRTDTAAPVLAGTRILSAAQNGAAIDLALETIARLYGKKLALGAAQELGYRWGTETLSVELLP